MEIEVFLKEERRRYLQMKRKRKVDLKSSIVEKNRMRQEKCKYERMIEGC